jgi:lipopolysaccharide export system protein LptC
VNRGVLLIAGLLLAAFATTWLLRHNTVRPDTADRYRGPDYYMENFTTLSMNADGNPEMRLEGVYMANYEDDDSSELLLPRIEIFRDGRPPLHVTAERGWVTADSDIVLLRGEVRMWEDDEDGRARLQVDTSEVRVLTREEYAETDRPTTIRVNRATVTGTGFRADFRDRRLEILNHERTTIAPAPRD